MTLPRTRTRLLATALASSLLLAPLAQAGDNMTASETSTMLAVLSPVMVISIPAMLSATVVMNASSLSDHLSSRGQEEEEKKPALTPAQVPDMEVKAIVDREDGGRQVRLQDPANPENTAQLQWPARADDPAGVFHIGQNVAFTSSEEGSGWLLRNGTAQGEALAFVPTGQALLNSHSDTLQAR